MLKHRNIHSGLSALISAYLQGKNPEVALNHLLTRNPRWGKRDREMLRHYFYTFLRYRNLVEALAARCAGASAAYLATVSIWLSDGVLPAFDERGKPFAQCLEQNRQGLLQSPLYRYGIPQWLWDNLQSVAPDRREKLLHRLNLPSRPVIRINTLKITPKEMTDLFRRKGYRFSPGPWPEALIFEKNYRLTSTPWYRRGLFEIQDLHSQQVVKFAGVRPGQTVVDACAGAGGKTLQLAAEMNNSGTLVALDIDRQKLSELTQRARRAGVENLKYAGLPHKQIIDQWAGKADLVLADAPCSSSGTYKRKPHRKWAWGEHRFRQTLQIQAGILDDYSRLVRPGGKLIYITCSVLPAENQRQIQSFLERNNSFIFVRDLHLNPGPEVGDGFYVAELKKTD